MANTPLETNQIGQREANTLPETEYIKIEDEVLTSNSELFETLSDLEKSEHKEIVDTQIQINDSEHKSHTELQSLPTKTKKEEAASLMKNNMTKNEKKIKKKTQERAKFKDQIVSSKIVYKDPLYHFFMSMYESTKVMPPSARHTVKKKVFQVVSQIEASLLTSNSTNDNNQATCHKAANYDVINRLNSDLLYYFSDTTTSQSFSHSSSSE